MDRILVIGAGLLGSRLVEQARGKYEVSAADVDSSLSDVGCDFNFLDITDKKAVNELIGKLKPAAVFQTAGMTDIDRCEEAPIQARRVNGSACGYIALACAKVNAYLCAISSSHVFDGRTGMYKEEARVRPINEYGRSKLMGEEEVRCLGERWRWTIIRTSMLYGRHGSHPNFVTDIIRELRAGRTVPAISDQFGSPTLADDLADACLALWRKEARGLFHFAGCERLSRYGLALKLCEALKLDGALVRPITAGELRQKAPRPPDASLDVTKAEKALGRKLLDAAQGLKRLTAQST